MTEDQDYVVVGAGSAGCVLAARLSEDPDVRVLLLEAGPADDVPEIAVPAAAPSLWHGPLAWQDQTAAQVHAAGRQVRWPRGRVLGGSSAVNGMLYVRGNPLDYDSWRDVHGCAGWGFADLLPYFLRAEDQARGPSALHGSGGPLRVEDLRFVHPLSRAWVEAAVAWGLPANDDFNGPTQLGAGLYQVTQRGGRRWSAADGYLRPALRRPNLEVRTGCHATTLIVTADRVVGVRYQHGGVELEARARREVVLACGAVGTPHLLLRSGIGPADDLRRLGVDVVVDAPAVGEGLADHPLCYADWYTPDMPNVLELATDEALAQWQAEGRGPLASLGAEAGAFLRTHPDLPAPDLQLTALASLAPGPDLSLPTERGTTVSIVATDVRSRGSVTLRSRDPLEGPRVDPGYLRDETDLDVLAAGVRIAQEIAGCEPLAGLVDRAHEPAPNLDDEALRAWIRGRVDTSFHPTGTCAMGGSSDAVCDPDLRVRHLEGLRIADASVMPSPPRGNTNAPTIAVAERASDLIRGVASRGASIRAEEAGAAS